MLRNAERLRELMRLIEAGEHETPGARELMAKLENILGADHADLRRLRARINHLPALRRGGNRATNP